MVHVVWFIILLKYLFSIVFKKENKRRRNILALIYRNSIICFFTGVQIVRMIMGCPCCVPSYSIWFSVLASLLFYSQQSECVNGRAPAFFEVLSCARSLHCFRHVSTSCTSWNRKLWGDLYHLPLLVKVRDEDNIIFIFLTDVLLHLYGSTVYFNSLNIVNRNCKSYDDVLFGLFLVRESIKTLTLRYF